MVDNQSSYVRIRSGGVTYALCLVPSGQGPAGCPKVRRGGVTYDVYTVSTVDQYASPVRVHFAGSTKAVRFYTEHNDVAHIDCQYSDVDHSDFSDVAHGDFTDAHSDGVAHVDSHLNYSDSTYPHIDADEAPIPWMNHNNVPHYNQAHYNIPFQDSPHLDVPHSDVIPWMHMDFTDTHAPYNNYTDNTFTHLDYYDSSVWTHPYFDFDNHADVAHQNVPYVDVDHVNVPYGDYSDTFHADFTNLGTIFLNYTDNIHSDYVDSQSFPTTYQDHSNVYSDVGHVDFYHSDVVTPHSDFTDGSHGDNVDHSDAEIVPTFKS